MSPKKSGVASPVESSDQKIEKVLEFHESARFSIKIFFVKIYPSALIIIHSSLSEPKANSEERKPFMPINFLRRGGVQINKGPTQG